MIIYRDAVTGEEVLTDSYPCKELFGGVLYEITGKVVTETTDIDDSKLGGNASAEAELGEGGAEASSVSGINVAIANKLTEIPVQMTKKELKTYLKKYSGFIKTRLEGTPRLETFVKNAQDAAIKVLSMLEEAVIFGHEGCDCKGPPLDIDGVLQYGIVMALYEQDGKTVHLYYWRDALEEEKA